MITAFLCGKAQTTLDHGIGANVGFSDGTTAGLEYEASILNNTSGYEKGLIAGVGGIYPFDNATKKHGFYLKPGYRLSKISFGANVGVKKEYEVKNNEYETGILAGGWVAYNITGSIKAQIGMDNFRGFNFGFVFRLNKR